MSTPATPRRVLVALDASPSSRDTAEAAARLAAHLRAELVGLFVEDADLLSLAAQPFARRLDLLSGAVRSAEQAQVERELRLQARRARQLLEEIAGRRDIAWSFRVTRGPVAAEIVAAAAGAQLLALGRIGLSRGWGRPLGSTARAVLGEIGGSLLLPVEPLPERPHLVVPFDGSPAAAETLDRAAHLAAAGEGSITVLLPGGDAEVVQQARLEASRIVAAHGLEARIEELPVLDLPAVVEAVRSRQGGLLSVFRGSPHLAEEELLEQLRDLLLLGL